MEEEKLEYPDLRYSIRPPLCNPSACYIAFDYLSVMLIRHPVVHSSCCAVLVLDHAVPLEVNGS